MDCHGRRLSSPGKVLVAFLTRVVRKILHGGSVQKLESQILTTATNPLTHLFLFQQQFPEYFLLQVFKRGTAAGTGDDQDHKTRENLGSHENKI